eukprot:33875-Chlamydomonas_euryale.AAC.1
MAALPIQHHVSRPSCVQQLQRAAQHVVDGRQLLSLPAVGQLQLLPAAGQLLPAAGQRLQAA